MFFSLSLLVFASLLICWLYSPFLWAHIHEAQNPYSFADDARHHIAPFLNYYDNSLFQNDYPTQYYLDALSPTLWKGLYYLASFVMDPISFSKLLPYPLWLLTIIGLGLTVYKISGRAAAIGVLLFAIPAPVFFDRMIGGLSRSFAFPLLIWGVYALVTSRFRLLVVLTVLGAGFYPTPAIILGVMLFFGLFFQHFREPSKAPSLKYSLVLLFLAGVGSVIMFLPPLLGASKYGPRLTENDYAAYPEVGEGGRYGGSEHGPHIRYDQGLVRYTQSSFVPRREPYLESFLKSTALVDTNRRSFLFRIKIEVLSNLGILLLIILIYRRIRYRSQSNAGIDAIFIFGLSSILTHALAVYFYPHLFFPQRYIVFTAPLIAFLIYGASLGFLKKDLLVLMVSLVALFLFGGPSKENEGYITADKNLIPLYKFIGELPKESRIAGWPKGPLSNVAYLSRRPTFLTIEINQAFHQKYLDVMRERMRLLMAAYFSKGDMQPLLRLKENEKVTHILVDTTHFKDNPPTYFLPLSQEISPFLANAKPEDFLLSKLVETSSVYRSGNLALIDLVNLKFGDVSK